MNDELLEDLNARVSEAIFEAEHAESGLPEEAAYRKVSALEEEIARALPAADVEGAVARVGAVSAALRSGDWLRAARLADEFMSGAPPELSEQLRELAAEADAAGMAVEEPEVRAVSFQLAAA